MKIMMKLVNNKRSIIVLLLMFLMMGCLLGTTSDLIAFAADTNAFDRTFVMDDLNSSTVNGVPFDAADYPQEAEGTLCVLNFVEYCYSPYANGRGDYALYIYLYNPQSLNIATGSASNTVQISITQAEEDNPKNHEKYGLQFCSKSTNNLFYKFKVTDHKSKTDGKLIADKVNSKKRIYNVSSFEIFTYGSTSAKDYGVGGKYTFIGFASGYGYAGDTQSTLTSIVDDMETLHLDLKSTVYRPVGSGTIDGNFSYDTQNQLNTVYFSLPNKLMRKYGDISGIRASFYEYKSSPIVVVDNKAVYDELSKFVGKTLVGDPNKFGKFDETCKYILYDNTVFQAMMPGSLDKNVTPFFSYNCVFQKVNTFPLVILPVARTLPYLFYTGNHVGNNPNPLAKDFNLPEEALLDYIYKYNASYENGKLAIKDGISKDLFLGKVDDGHTEGYQIIDMPASKTFKLTSFVENTPWYKTLLSFGLHREFGNYGYDNIKAIIPISMDDFNGDATAICNKLFIGAEDYNDVYNSCLDAATSDSTVNLFRFAQSNYTARPVEITQLGLFNFDHAYMAEQTVYLDFDILDLTFCKDGVYHVIPVVADPIDIAGNTSAPIKYKSWSERMKDAFNEFGQILKDFFKTAGKWVLIAIGAIILVVIACCIIKSLVTSRRGGVNVHVISDSGTKPSKAARSAKQIKASKPLKKPSKAKPKPKPKTKAKPKSQAKKYTPKKYMR